MIYFVFKKSLSILSYYTAIFLVSAHRFGVPFPKLQTFSKIFWALHIGLQSIRKNDTRNFCLFVYLRSCNGKSKCSLLETVQSSDNTCYLRMSHFCARCLHRFLALIFLYTLGKIPWKNYVRFLKWNLKRTSKSA